jgi:hypothetical protein
LVKISSGDTLAYIESDLSILHLTRLGDRELFIKVPGEVFFINYVNIVGSKIDRLDLICIPCAPDMIQPDMIQ